MADDAAPIELAEDEEGRAVTVFLAMDTQWRQAGMAGVATGLDYNAIAATADLAGVSLAPKPAFLRDLKILEEEALKSWSEQRARDK